MKKVPESLIRLKLKINWDYTVLAITYSHVLVRLLKEDQDEFVVWEYSAEGDCYSGFYTYSKDSAINRFKEKGFTNYEN